MRRAEPRAGSDESGSGQWDLGVPLNAFGVVVPALVILGAVIALRLHGRRVQGGFAIFTLLWFSFFAAVDVTVIGSCQTEGADQPWVGPERAAAR